MSVLDPLLISSIVEQCSKLQNKYQIAYDVIHPQVSFDHFVDAAQKLDHPEVERRKAMKIISKQIQQMSGHRQQIKLSSFQFDCIFNKIKTEMRQLLKFQTSQGEFGLNFIEYKYKNQTYAESSGHQVDEHHELIIQELILTLSIASHEKIISVEDENIILDYIKKITAPK